MKSDAVYLEHMLECLEWVVSHTAKGREVFLRDRKTQSAVLRELQTRAESCMKLSGPLKATQPSIPRDYIAGFRNVVVHDYLCLDLDRIWNMVEQDVLALRSAVIQMQQSLDGTVP